MAIRHAARVERHDGGRRSHPGTDRSFADRGAGLAKAEPRGAIVPVIGSIVRPPRIRIPQLLYALRAGRDACMRDSCVGALVLDLPGIEELHALGAWHLLCRGRMSLRLGWVLGLLAPLLVWSSPAGAQCGGTQVCAAGAGDCTIASSCTITVPAGGLTIDLGARKLVLTKTLTVQGSDVLTINAGSVLVDGGSIIAPGASGIGGSLSILAATSMTFQNDALVDVSAGVAGGVVDLEALNGDLDYSGRIKANGTTRDGDGGGVSASATGNMTVAGGTVDASGGDRAGGGFIDIEVTNGSLVVSSTLSAPGGDGGDLILVGGTSLQTTASADIDVSASGDAGSGGSIDLSASGDLSIAGNADGTGAVSADPTFSDGGDGADYCLTSDTGSITVTGQADMSA